MNAKQTQIMGGGGRDEDNAEDSAQASGQVQINTEVWTACWMKSTDCWKTTPRNSFVPMYKRVANSHCEYRGIRIDPQDHGH